MLETIKEEVCKIAKRAQADGLCKHKAGNFSVRDKDTGYIVVTPTSVDREYLKPDDMIVMELDGTIIESLSGLRPSSECLMHLKIYETRSDIHAIVHTHSLFATTFAVLNKPIPAIVYEVASMGLTKARIPVAPYGRPGTPDLANSVVDACQESEAFLLEKHGTVATDKVSLYEAYLKAHYIEEVAELYYRSLTVLQGKEPEGFTQDELSAWKYPEALSK